MPTLKGFTFKNQTETSADLYFYGDIVSDWWGAWQDEDQYPDAIKNFLSEQEGKDLNVYVIPAAVPYLPGSRSIT